MQKERKIKIERDRRPHSEVALPKKGPTKANCKKKETLQPGGFGKQR